MSAPRPSPIQGLWLLIGALVAAGSPALAQITADNVVRGAQDAFGLSIGSESLGLYSMDQARGFSPATAGNLRIEGLYFRRQGWLTNRIVDTVAMRLGASAIGQVLPAPSGIADISLRNPSQSGAEVILGIGPLVSPYLVVNSAMVADDGEWKLAGGFSVAPDENWSQGGDAQSYNVGFTPRWQPNERVTVIGYFDREWARDSEVAPAFYPAGPYLPPKPARKRYNAPSWTEYAYNAQNEGLIVKADLGDGLTLRSGIFHSVFNPKSDAAGLVGGLTPAGDGTLTYVMLPEQRFASYSGDSQLEYAWSGSDWRQSLTLVGRGRWSDSRYGGDHVVELGSWRANQPDPSDPPSFSFDGTQDRDKVHHYAGGLSWRLQWAGRLDLGAGLQRADYTKTFRPGSGGREQGSTSPWLYNGVAAWAFSDAVVGYASYSRGLEESGSAPVTALNRNQVLPAVQTKQKEVGARVTAGPVTLTGALFDVRRPYAGMDDRDVYGFVGTVRHRGVEASLTAQPVEGLSTVLGAVLLDPRLSGPLVDRGGIGRRPVNQPKLRLQANFDYAPASWNGASIDLSTTHIASSYGRRDNQARIPDFTSVNVGIRQPLTLMGQDTSLRVMVMDLFDQYGLNSVGDNGYELRAGRRWRMTLTTQF